MIDTTPFRRKLLDLAITGKLVPKQGEWRTVKLEDGCSLIADCPHTTAPDEGAGFPLIRTPNVGFGKLELGGVHRVSKLVYETRILRGKPEAGDLIFAREAPAGNVAVIGEGEQVCLGQRTVLFKPIRTIIDSKFLAYYILSPTVQKQLVSQATGSTVAHVNLGSIRPFQVRVPSLAEQKAIVKRLEELLKLEGEIAAESAALDDLITAAKRKVLDLAIRGKLVPQDSSDEPASELLKRIAAKRETQVSTDRRSRSKGSSVIFRGADRSAYETCDGKTVCIDDEIPFDIPDSWAWARLGSVSDYGKCVSVSTDQLSADTWSLDLEEIAKETGRLIERKTIGEKVSTSAKHVFKKGMVLYSKLRTYLNKVMVADMDGVCTSEIIPISLEGGILPEYLRNVLMSSYFLSYTAIRDYGVKMPRIGTEDARKALIPIPPFAEQKRIVAKVEKVRNLIELTTRT